MRYVRFLHRWAGALVGLFLTVMGITGMLLAMQSWWLHLPGEIRASADDAAIVRVLERTTAHRAAMPTAIIMPSDELGLFTARYGRIAGAYVDHQGAEIVRWQDVTERPEVFLFQLHRYWLIGEAGETWNGVLAFIALGFVVTGLILWWRARRKFRPRLWPQGFSRAALMRHHRDLGALAAPLLILSCVTGAALSLKPFSDLLVRPLGAPTVMKKTVKPPKVEPAPMAAKPDWRRMLADAHRLYPEARVTVLSFPKKPGEPITMRMRQPDEWLPKGRTLVWFSPATGAVAGHQDSRTMPLGLRVQNSFFPLHSGHVGGLAYKLAVIATGLALTLLGLFAIFSFWRTQIRRLRPVRLDPPRADVSRIGAG